MSQNGEQKTDVTSSGFFPSPHTGGEAPANPRWLTQHLCKYSLKSWRYLTWFKLPDLGVCSSYCTLNSIFCVTALAVQNLHEDNSFCSLSRESLAPKRSPLQFFSSGWFLSSRRAFNFRHCFCDFWKKATQTAFFSSLVPLFHFT